MAKSKTRKAKRPKAKKRRKKNVLRQRIIAIIEKKVAEGFDFTSVEILTPEEKKVLESISIDDILEKARKRQKQEEQ